MTKILTFWERNYPMDIRSIIKRRNVIFWGTAIVLFIVH